MHTLIADYLRTRGFAPTTERAHANSLARFARFLTKPLTDARENDAQAFGRYLLTDHHAPHSAYVAELRATAFARWLRERAGEPDPELRPAWDWQPHQPTPIEPEHEDEPVITESPVLSVFVPVARHYLRELERVHRRAPATVRIARAALEQWAWRLEERETDWTNATRADLGTWALELQKKRSRGGVGTVVSAVRAFYRWAEHEALTPRTGTSPGRFTWKRPPLPPITYIEESDAIAVASAFTGDSPRERRERAVMELLYATGLRVSELAALDVQDVDLVHRLAVVRHGKGDRSRVVLFGEPARIALAVYLRFTRPVLVTPKTIGEPLFLNAHGTRLTTQAIQKATHRATARAGVHQHVTPHVLRKTAATHMLRRGADLRVAQHLLGHASMNTTARYYIAAANTDRLGEIVVAAMKRAREANAARREQRTS